MRLTVFALLAVALGAGELPVRGLHLSAPRPEDIPLAVRFITGALPREGVNLLVLEINYHYRFTKHPEVTDEPALSREDLVQVAAACRKAGVRLIPQINLLGHQSWAKNTSGLLRSHPEFDETPGLYPANEGIYCRSYCPLHPGVHDVVFDLIDELADACQADAFHIGMDEVFLLGEDACPRCRGRNKAELFAGEVRALRDHLTDRNRTTWMWGDRFLDGDTTGLGKWEGAVNQTHDAVRLIPKDIVICDWHYESPVPTAAWFALNGFAVVSSPWRKPEVALGQLDLVRAMRASGPVPVRARSLGMLQTTWQSFAGFVRGYYGEATSQDARSVEAVNCFRQLFQRMRERPVTR